MEQNQFLTMTAREISCMLAFVGTSKEDIRFCPKVIGKKLSASLPEIINKLSRYKSYLSVVRPDKTFLVKLCDEELRSLGTILLLREKGSRQGRILGVLAIKIKQKLGSGNQTFIPKAPLINILVRTSGRPEFFKRCYESIQTQNYKHINLIVSYDNPESYAYAKKCGADRFIKVAPLQKTNSTGHFFYPGLCCKPFPANAYLDDMLEEVGKGFVLVLDDDKALSSPGALETLALRLTNNDVLVFWPVKFPKRTVPGLRALGQMPQPGHIDMAGFCFHTDYSSYVKFGGYSYADYRVAMNLYMNVPHKKYISEPLTALQSVPGQGERKDLFETQLSHHYE